MKKKKLLILIILIFVLEIVGCKKGSTFSIQFIDVGQGDAALVECDGHYMLIDGGDSFHDNVYQELTAKGIQHLDILAISHLHEDHYGGLVKALKYATKIDLTISNSTYVDKPAFRELQSVLSTNGATITVPNEGDIYNLGSATVEVIDNTKTTDNDSLVLMITYGKTKFLFTGDIEESAQKRISTKYGGYEGKKYDKDGIDVIKMPHHGQDTTTLYVFLRTFMPKNAIISVGQNNNYNHPNKQTIDKLNDLEASVFRTDKNGDIMVLSDGKKVTVKPQKQ